MFLAVDNYSQNPGTFSGIIGILLCVSVFIICGFEHSIADISYILLAINSYKQIVEYLWFIFVVSVFNGIGALVLQKFLYPIKRK